MSRLAWWQTGHVSLVETLVAALNHASTAFDAISEVREIFDALNPVWNAHAAVAAVEDAQLTKNDWIWKDANALTCLLVNQVAVRDASTLCRSLVLERLVGLRPHLENEGTKLRQRQRRARRVEGTKTDERYEHVQLQAALTTLENDPRDVRLGMVLDRLARFLYVLRSNIAHGHKTPKGPDLEGEARDRRICEAALPVLNLLVSALLSHPETRLAAYGTLRQGRENEAVLTRHHGAWIGIGLARGTVVEWDGYPCLLPAPPGDVPVELYESAALPGAWGELDTFEGERYERVLAAIRMGDSVVVASIYQGAPQAVR